MSKNFVYNRDTLSYEVVNLSLAFRLRRMFAWLLSSIVASTILIYAFSYFSETPKSILLRRENEALQIRYGVAKQRLNKNNEILDDILQRDNRVYRSIFEVDIIPVTAREAGMGKMHQYEGLFADKRTAIAGETLLLLDRITKKAYIQSKSLDEISELTLQKEKMMDCIPSIQPLNISNPKIRISALFGARVDPIFHVLKMHDGIDLAGPLNTPIYATGNGKVVESTFNFHGYGNSILIDHGFGYKTRYAHLNRIVVNEGAYVKRGTLIGLLGNTGKSTGSHLHYEVRYHNKPVNPVNFFSTDITEEEFNKFIQAISGKMSGGTEY